MDRSRPGQSTDLRFVYPRGPACPRPLRLQAGLGPAVHWHSSLAGPPQLLTHLGPLATAGEPGGVAPGRACRRLVTGTGTHSPPLPVLDSESDSDRLSLHSEVESDPEWDARSPLVSEFEQESDSDPGPDELELDLGARPRFKDFGGMGVQNGL